jgi:radical SAM superfamily enzyme YgiQ (UPF0313 family)
VQASSVGIASSESLVKKMSRAGFKYVFLGIENPSKKILKELDKGDIVNKSKIAVTYLRENGIVIGGGFIIGNPDDDYESIETAFKFARELQVDFDAFQFLTPYPKTKIREKLIENDLLINKDNYRHYNGGIVVARTKFLNENELRLIKYKLTKKYFKTTKINTFKAIMKHKKTSMKLFKGAVGLIPNLIGYLFLEKIKKLLLDEKKLVNKNLEQKLKINEFNI